MGFNLSDSSSVSPYIPFKYLTKNNVIKEPEPGVLIYESFDRQIWKLNNWSTLWMAEKGKVTKTYDNNGNNNSRVLLIKSKSSKGWAYSHYMFIQVKPGDRFSFDGFVNIYIAT